MKWETIRKKCANFWYYYKWYVLGGLLLLCALAVAINSCVNRARPDLYVLFARNDSPDSMQLLELEQWFGNLAEDVNKDGEKSASVIATATVDQWTGNNSSAMLVQVNSGSAVLYLLSEQNYETLHQNGILQELDFIEGESAWLEGDRYRLSASGVLDSITGFTQEKQEYYLCLRRVEGTSFEGNEKYETQQALAREVIRKLVAAESQ